jgi:hypothetical protein
MSFLMYAAKRAIIDAIATALAGPPAVQVAYSLPPDPDYVCVYGGGLRMVQTDNVAEPGVATVEADVIDVWVRVYAPGDDVRGADAQAEPVANTIIHLFQTNPRLVGVGTVSAVSAGDGGEPTASPGPEPAVVSKLLLQVTVIGDA